LESTLEIVAVAAALGEHQTPLLAVGVSQGEKAPSKSAAEVDVALGGQIARLLARGDFKGKEGETQFLYPANGHHQVERVLLVGLGKPEKLDLERLRRAAAVAVKQGARLGLDRISFVADEVDLEARGLEIADAARALAEGFVLGGYVFGEYKAKVSDEGDEAPSQRVGRVEILTGGNVPAEEIDRGIRLGSVIAHAENLARRLGNLPGNIATPSYLAETAQGIASRTGMRLAVLGPRELEEEGLEALLAVSRGSEQEPRLIVLEHRRGPADARPLVLVGKGLTFDSGGISIKPALSMEEMKFDMCGGGAVLATMQAIGELDLPINVVGIVPSTENLISGRALKPGDIIRTHLGKTIEVVNTDAEGRLILADALSYARRFEPIAMVDAATLTGACVISLGHQASAVLGNDEALVTEIRDAGSRTGERAWPLPMFDEYRDQLKSDYADIKNSGGRPAGAITAAWFLREFVGEVPWAHLDIAGTAYGDGKLPYQTKGATGAPTRLLTEWVLSRVA
jgi:leucyl aminopeptidase